ncbi:MAG: DUF262 domain-containing protein [Paludibacteraceae bacterium]|nr:DUF262 domain-containing protein [Paludibacteraceae bacterium]
MKGNELIKSISDIFSEAIESKKKYIIPAYQRGYKWNRVNIFKLLEDLQSFEKSNKDNESFYCLQNITIVPLESNEGWNVVDGQQRLTTLYILLSYLRKYKSDNLSFFSSPECLKYNVREETGAFLEEKIWTGEIWNDDNTIEPDHAESKDKWYMLDVAKAIKEWFADNDLQVDTITERLKLIVNNMKSETVREEEIFAGLNGGKVDLDGADLVRAVLITRSAKEKYNGPLAVKVSEFRMRIALELDEMNLWWAQSEQKTFFEQFLPNSMLKSSAFDHDTYPIGLLYKLYFQIYHKDNEKFGIEFFENGRNLNDKTGDDHWELYDSLLNMHHILQMWFDDPLLYHWLGYLIFRFKDRLIPESSDKSTDKSKITVNFKTIWSLWGESETKEVFLINILCFIQKLLSDSEEQLETNIREVNKQWYGINTNELTNILVLMDIMVCTGLYRDYWKEELSTDDIATKPTKISNMKVGKLRLPVVYFSKHNENFEHIRSCAPNQEEGKEVKSKEEWIKHINSIYKDCEDVENAEKTMRDTLLGMLNDYSEETLSDAIIEQMNNEMNKYGQHSIGNLALLDERINKSYRNDLFQKKIQRIFREYMNSDCYIRPYTMMVFEHKIKDSDKAWRWTQSNIKENSANIANNINTILNLKQ